MNTPKLYTLNCDHNIGRLTKNSLRVEQQKCEDCKRTISTEIKFSAIEFEFDEYNEEDMFHSMGCLIVTERLFQSLQNANIKGFAPLRVKTKKSKYFEGKFDSKKTFIYLAILPPDAKNIPIAYKFAGACSTCGHNKGETNSVDFDLMYRKSDVNQLSLNVYLDSWNGSDILYFQDHFEIGVTENFLNVIKDFNCPNNIVIPCQWI